MNDYRNEAPDKNMDKNPFDVLLEYSRRNPTASVVLLGGVAAFASIAIILELGIDLQSNIPSVVYLVTVGVVLYTISLLFNDIAINIIIRWVVLVLCFIWCGVFVLHRLNPKWEELACAVYFWTPCKVIADRVNEDDSQEGAVTPAPSPTPRSRPYPVFMQFAGLGRDEVRNSMRALASKGWRLQGIEGGGQRTPNAAGYAEVRFPQSSDQEAANQLVQDIKSTRLVAKDIKAVENPLVKPGTLEIWISR